MLKRIALILAVLLSLVSGFAFADVLERRAVRAGWDMISVPGAVEEEDLCVIAGGGGAAVFDLRERAYRSCADGPVMLAPGRAYWVHFSESGEVDFPRAEGSPRVSVVVKRGWNLIGAPTGGIVPWDDNILVNGAALSKSRCLLSKPFAYDPVSGGWREAAVLEPWRGYAVLAAEECAITFPGEGEGEVDIVFADLLPDAVVELGDGTRAVAGQVVARRAAGVDEGAFLKRVSEAGGVVRGVNSFLGIYQVEFSGDARAAAEALQAAPEVASAAPNIIFSLDDFTPDDPPWAAGAPGEMSWAFERIGAPKVWSASPLAQPPAAAPVIAVVDTGVDGAHPDLAWRVTAGAGFVVSGDPADTDPHGHGTHIAGIAAAVGGNGEGIAGVCWNCRIMPVKVCGAGGDCPFFSVLNGITYAANNGADVINISLTANAAPGSPARQIFQDVIDYAAGKGAFVVASAGNGGADASNTIPASLDGVFAVGATDANDARAPFSNFGGAVDIAAPGRRIYSLAPGGGAGYRDGTSAAAGFVSGAAGLVLTLQPTLTNSEVEELLESTAAPVVSAEPLGAGRLDLSAAYEKMYPSNKPPEIIEFNVSSTEVAPGGAVQVSFKAMDPDGDNISYNWSVDGGALSAPNSTTTGWTLPAIPGVYAVRVSVFDGRGGSASEERKVVVGVGELLRLRVYPPVIALKQGESIQLKAYATLVRGDIIPVSPGWTLDAPVGVINTGGKFTATAEGEAIITAAIGGVEARARVFVDVGVSYPSMVLAGFADSGQDIGGFNDEAVVAGDVDGDGDNDLVIGQINDVNKVYKNNGAGTFVWAQDIPGVLTTTYLDLGDIDNDGDLDLVESGANQGWRVYTNNGAGSFTDTGQVLANGTLAYSARLADVDNDGDLDLLGANRLNGAQSYLFLNNGAGVFSVTQNIGSTSPTQRIQPADVNRDGYIDFVEANDLLQPDRVFINNGAGGFSDSGQTLGGNTSTAHAALADVNADGSADLLTCDSTNSRINVFTNNGAGVFSAAGNFNGGKDNRFLDLGDHDNNGTLDVVTAVVGANQQVYNNNGAGVFADSGGAYAPDVTYVRFGDLDGDGDLDFANGNTVGGSDIFINDTNASTAPSIPAGLLTGVIGNDPTFSWNPSTDAESASNLITYDLRVGTSSGGNQIFSGVVKAGPGNVGHPDIGGTLKHTLKDFSNGVYYWSVRAVDAQYRRSAWAAEQLFAILAPAGICTVMNKNDLGVGSLRECITWANGSAGADTITFDAAVDWNLPANTITLASSLPDLTDVTGGTTISNTTGKVVTISGDNLIFNCLIIKSNNNVIAGLKMIKCEDNAPGSGIVAAIRVSGAYSGNQVYGNVLQENDYGIIIEGGANNNTIGSAIPNGNLLSGNDMFGIYIKDNGTNGNVLIGNLIGVDAAGTGAMPNVFGVSIFNGPDANVIGSVNSNERNIISGNDGAGVSISGNSADGNIIIGNYIGLDLNGTAEVANTQIGIDISNGSKNNIIGGTTVPERNLIAGNSGAGISLGSAGTEGNEVDGNYIGLDAGGNPFPNSAGILIWVSAANNEIGVNNGNVIANNDVNGITVSDNANNNTIFGNEIYGNVALGIRVKDAGTDYNTISQNSIYSNITDLGIDLDGAGANENIAAPVITCADDLGGNSYEVNGTACAGCVVEVFRVDNAAAPAVGQDGSGAGEGYEYLGSITTVTTDFTITVTVAGGSYVTATVTDAAGNTSEFAANVDVTSTPCVATPCTGWKVATNADSGDGSLRSCITEANTTANAQTITFDNSLIGQTISPTSQLPTLSDATGGATVDGTGQNITISGSLCANCHGFEISSASNQIKGLTITSFSGVDKAAVYINGGSASGNTVSGCKIGNDGASVVFPMNDHGVWINGGADNNVVGGSTAADRNIISGNNIYGVYISGAGTTGNAVKGNYIGTDSAGTSVISNKGGGITIENQASGNYIGDGTSAGRNIISGNNGVAPFTTAGIFINGTGTDGNTVIGNYIGTDVTGAAAILSDLGVVIGTGAKNNIIGGVNNLGPGCAGECNLLSGNLSAVTIYDSGTNDNEVIGNYIGTDNTGAAALPNWDCGVCLFTGARSNKIGGSAMGEANIIAYNGAAGVYVEGANSDFNKISRNQIYSNTGLGIDLDGAGANNDINKPTFTSIALNGANYDVDVAVAVCPSAPCTVELFCVDDTASGVTADGSGAGEGFKYLASAVSPYDFTNLDVLATCPDTTELTATVTDNTGNTSEFADNEALPTSTCPGWEVENNADSGDGSLRSCITEANAAANAQTITFDNSLIGQTITLASSLPTINDATGGTTIDGDIDGDTIPDVTVSGNSGDFDCFTIESADNTIRGLTIVLCDGPTPPAGILIKGASATGNKIVGNYIGTNASSAAGLGNYTGIRFNYGGGNNIIGGVTAAERNIISGNFLGIGVTGPNGLKVIGNYIGTNVAGTAALGNADGIFMGIEAQNNIIGGTTAGERNIISGNSIDGIMLSGNATTGNQIVGNHIGTNVAGTAALANGNGIYIYNGANNNTIGGATADERNVISGNTVMGISIRDAGTDSNKIIGNYIGVDFTGAAALANGMGGITIFASARSNKIGGAAAGEQNIIAYNGGDGVELTGASTDYNTISRNRIYSNTGLGIDLVGAGANNDINKPTFTSIVQNGANYDIDVAVAACPSAPCAVELFCVDDTASGVTADGTGAGEGWKYLASAGSPYDFTNLDVAATCPNTTEVTATVTDSTGNTSEFADNELLPGTICPGWEVANNNDSGIGSLRACITEANSAAGAQAITFDAAFAWTTNPISLASALPTISDATGGTTINNTTGGEITVSGNNGDFTCFTISSANNAIKGLTINRCTGATWNTSAVSITGASATNNTISGNYIGTNSAGAAGIGNKLGVYISSGASGNTVGGTAAVDRNIISGNSSTGIFISSGTTANNTVIGNYIGANPAGTAALANVSGIDIYSGTKNNTIGGDAANERNIISGNTGQGIRINGSGTDGNKVTGNYIGTDVTGAAALPNGSNGVYIYNGARSNIVGYSTVDGEANLIANNGGRGVYVANVNTDYNKISRNQIYSNTGLGIGLDGAGANDDINKPTFTSIVLNGTNYDVDVAVAVCPAAPCAVELFCVDDPPGVTPDGSGAGEGFKYLASAVSPYDFTNLDVLATCPDTTELTATVTDNTGNTSEFADNEPLPTSLCPGWTVTSNADTATVGTLRSCITEANADGVANTITFTISGQTIQPATQLPTLSDATGGTTIDATGKNIIIDGNSLNIYGFVITSNSNTIRGLSIIRFNQITRYALYIDGGDNNTVAGNYIGTNFAFGAGLANRGNVKLINGASNNTIGGINAADRNYIAFSAGDAGVAITGAGSDNNEVYGNYIGTDSTGALNLGNEVGVSVSTGAGNKIGGPNPGEANLIVNSAGNGVYVNGAAADNNKISRNQIYSNTGLGIDLDGAGANNDINKPTFTSIALNGANYDVEINLSGCTTANCNIELFCVDDPPGITPDGTGAGEAYKYLAESGNQPAAAPYTFTAVDVAASCPNTTELTATITSTDGNTSEFADNEALPTSLCPGWEVTTNADSGDGSLRSCITEANSTAGAQTITFDATMSGQTITLASALPSLTDDDTTINNNSGGEVTVSGNNGGFNCFTITSADNEIRGLTIVRCWDAAVQYHGIYITGVSATGNKIAGNYIGTNSASAAGLGNRIGIRIVNGAKNNIIGGTIPSDRNIISGNVGGTTAGIVIGNGGTDGNKVIGNYIGTNVSGNAALANEDGIEIAIGAMNNIIGGATAGERNIISGNTLTGVIIYGAGSENNKIIGNYIGTDVSGAATLGNERGVQINISAANNTVGGTTSGERNIISGNSVYGVVVGDAGTDGSIIRGNYIGTNAAGTAALPNAAGVAVLNGAQSTVVGGAAAGAANVISGNVVGINIDNSDLTQILGNKIGTRPDGVTALANTSNAIQLSNGAQNAIIGGTGAGEANIIANSGFGGAGVALTGATTDYNLISGNSIYTNAGKGISLAAGTNDDRGKPKLTCVSDLGGGSYRVEGEKCDGCVCNDCSVELFRADNAAAPVVVADAAGEGYEYLDSFTTLGTNLFSLTVTVSGGTKLSATAIDSSSNTSEFAVNMSIAAAALTVGAVTFTPDAIKADGVDSTILTAVVTDPNGACDIDTVTVNLTLLGGSATAQMYDDGTNGDAVADDGIYTRGGITAPLGFTPGGTYPFTVTAEDYAGGTDTGTDNLTINTPPTVANVTFNPNPAANGATVTAYAEVTDDNGVPGDISSVTINLTTVGGGAAAAMANSGACAVPSAKCRKYSVSFAVTHPGPFPASETLVVTATDTESQTDTDSGILQIVDIAPNPPILNSAVNNSGVIDLQWLSPSKYTDGSTIPAPLSGHNIYRRPIGGSYGPAPDFVDAASTATNTVYTYTDSTVVAFVEYCYKVTAVSATGVESAKSNEKCATALPDPYVYKTACGNVDPLHYYPPSTPGIFHRPLDVVADGAGFIYIADTDNNRVQKFDEDCNYVWHWGSLGSASGEFKAPKGIAYAGGEVYVVDAYDRVQVFTTGGAFRRKWTVLMPINIEYDPASGYLYVSTEFDWIYVFQTSGAYVTKFRAAGIKHLDLDAAGNIYYAQPYVSMVKVLDSAGNPAGEWGSEGTGYGEFEMPFGLAIDGSGLVYVSEQGNNRIQVFDTSGALKNVIPTSGAQYAPMSFPSGLAVSNFSGKTKLFICDRDSSRLIVFEEP